MTLSSTAVERAIAQGTSRWAMARGHRLNTSIVLAAVHGLSGLFRAVSAVEPFTLSPPSHSVPVPVPNRPTRLCGRKATLNQTKPSRVLASNRRKWIKIVVCRLHEVVRSIFIEKKYLFAFDLGAARAAAMPLRSLPVKSKNIQASS